MIYIPDNFEQGAWSSSDNPYTLFDNGAMIRNKVPFIMKKYDAIKVINSAYHFNMVTFTYDYIRTGSTNWVTEYTLTSDARICLLCVKRVDGTNINPADLDMSTIFDSNGLYIMTHNCILTNSILPNAMHEVKMQHSNAYIKTGVDVGTVVSLTPETYIGFKCAYEKCMAGDVYNVTGIAGNSGRLWAFLDKDRKLLSKETYGLCVQEKIIRAPQNARYVVFNANETDNRSTCYFYKGDSKKIQNIYKNAAVTTPVINYLNKDLISMPTITYHEKIQQTTGVSAAKGAIYKNGDYFCIVYGENINGTADDFPRATTNNGTLAMKYKFFKLTNGTKTQESFGTLAQKGTTYTTWDGNTATFTGGCALPSGADGMQYFSAAYAGNKRYNGIDNYGMTPCCCTVTVSSSGVTFGAIKELSLTIGSTKGKFDFYRISTENVNYSTYLTTSPPVKYNDTYYWVQPAKNGLILLKSTNRVDWTYMATINVDFAPACEVACSTIGNRLLCGIRTYGQEDAQIVHSTVYIACIKMDADGIISQMYKLNDISSRVWFAKSGNDVLMFYNATHRNIADCIRITLGGTSAFHEGLYFHKWFTIYKEGTWYIAANNDTIATKNFTKMYLVGGNDQGPSLANGMTFMELTFDSSKPNSPDDIALSIG